MAAIHWHSFFFLLFALVTCVSALAVVVASNIVRMAFYLVISLAGVAGLFFLAGADFLGAAQLMVYVGGTLVLLAFGVMLTARGPLVSMRTNAGQWILAGLVGVALFAMLLQTVLGVKPWNGRALAEIGVPQETKSTATDLGMGLLGVRSDEPGAAQSKTVGTASGYLLPFEIISVHLLVVLIGAAYLARAKRRVPPSGPEAQAET
jgi:NADH:ubiquinone oxidoreductase subunit 6 (subunit J)